MFENVRADLGRLTPAGSGSLRSALRGMLSQGFQALLIYRVFNALHRRGIPTQPFRFVFERFIEITTGISIPASCRIGKGLRIHHFGGIIFHPTAELGENCTIYHGVTIGDRGGDGDAARCGNNVLIGAGAKVIGDIVIGHDCIVGANAVVRKNMPDRTVAVGNPATLRPRRSPEPENDAEDGAAVKPTPTVAG